MEHKELLLLSIEGILLNAPGGNLKFASVHDAPSRCALAFSDDDNNWVG